MRGRFAAASSSRVITPTTSSRPPPTKSNSLSVRWSGRFRPRCRPQALCGWRAEFATARRSSPRSAQFGGGADRPSALAHGRVRLIRGMPPRPRRLGTGRRIRGAGLFAFGNFMAIHCLSPCADGCDLADRILQGRRCDLTDVATIPRRLLSRHRFGFKPGATLRWSVGAPGALGADRMDARYGHWRGFSGIHRLCHDRIASERIGRPLVSESMRNVGRLPRVAGALKVLLCRRRDRYRGSAARGHRGPVPSSRAARASDWKRARIDRLD